MHRWWLLLAVPAGLVAAGLLGLLTVLLLARSGLGGRVLLLERTPAGRALLTCPPRHRQLIPQVQVANVLAIPAHGVTPPSDRAQRPGATLLRRLVHQAREQQLDARLIATTGVAVKVNEPAGFLYDDGQQQRPRPRMHLPAPQQPGDAPHHGGGRADG